MNDGFTSRNDVYPGSTADPDACRRHGKTASPASAAGSCREWPGGAGGANWGDGLRGMDARNCEPLRDLTGTIKMKTNAALGLLLGGTGLVLLIPGGGRAGLAMGGANMCHDGANSLGLRIVQILAGQLRATVEVESSEGTEFTVTLEGQKK